jgi:hypothetical protein
MLAGLSWAITALSQAIHTGHARYWVISCLAMLVALYAHYGALLILAPVMSLTVLVVWWRQRGKSLKPLWVTLAGLGLFSSPLFLLWLPEQMSRYQAQSSRTITWQLGAFGVEMSQFWRLTRNIVYQQLTGFAVHRGTWQAAPVWLVIVLLLIPLVAALWHFRSHRLLWLWLLGSWAFYFVVGRLNAYPYNGSRHALILTPLLLPVCAIGLWAIAQKSRWLTGLILGGWVIIGLLAPPDDPQDLRAVTQFWLAEKQAGDATYVYQAAAPGFRYQLHLLGLASAEVPIAWYQKCWRNLPEPYCIEPPVYYSRWMRALSAAEKQHYFRQIVGEQSERVWLIFSHFSFQDKDDLIASLEVDYDVATEYQAVGAAAVLLVKR